MKRKIFPLSTAILFLIGIIIMPAYYFMSEFAVKEKIYSDFSVRSFSKNIIFTASSKINFGGFTKNLLSKANRNIDFSCLSALLSKGSLKTYFSYEKIFEPDNFAYKNPLICDFVISDRLRSPHLAHNSPVLFIFFILLYIGMLRAVFVFSKKSNVFYILKPLFLQTEVFHLRVLK